MYFPCLKIRIGLAVMVWVGSLGERSRQANLRVLMQNGAHNLKGRERSQVRERPIKISPEKLGWALVLAGDRRERSRKELFKDLYLPNLSSFNLRYIPQEELSLYFIHPPAPGSFGYSKYERVRRVEHCEESVESRDKLKSLSYYVKSFIIPQPFIFLKKNSLLGTGYADKMHARVQDHANNTNNLTSSKNNVLLNSTVKSI